MQSCRAASRKALFLMLALCMGGCSSKQVVVEGNFPVPLLEQLPLSMGVFYTSEFVNHEIFDEAQISGESDWRVSTGAAQVKFWDQFFEAMFGNYVSIRDWETLEANKGHLDGVMVPRITDLQYTVPERTNVNVYEIQFFYSFELFDPETFHLSEEGVVASHSDQAVAAWRLVSYGKTPSAFIQTAEEAVNLAAVVSLRDAGANFAQNFTITPSITAWLEEKTSADQPASNDSSFEK